MAKWATKNPPKHEGRYLVTVKNEFGYTVYQADRYTNGFNWFWFVLPTGMAGANVIAWQKQPEPYEGENNAKIY